MKNLIISFALTLFCGCGTTSSKIPTTPFDLSVGAKKDLAMGMSGADMAMPTMGGQDLAMDTDLSMDDAAGGADLAMSIGGDMAMMQTMGGDMSGCSAITKLYPGKPGEADVYCPFSGVNGGKSVYCQGPAQHCCEPAKGTSTCQAIGVACAKDDTDWQCEDPATDCAKGQVCCGTGTFVLGAPMCGNYASKFDGTHCAANCMPAEIQICEADNECSNGMKCLPFSSKGNDVGACQ